MSSTSRLARPAAGLLAAALTVLPLTGCSLNSKDVSCSGTSCSVNLTGDGAKAQVLGSTLSLGGIKDGRATLGVGGSSVSCTQGQSVAAGPLHLTCSTVTGDSVTLTASVG